MTNREAATQLRTAARRWVASVDADASERAMYAQDREALGVLAEYIKEGHLTWAMELASHLDTAVREEIPRTVWLHIGGELISRALKQARQG